MGKCRAERGGTMCPSYRATREERYSTRGRARLLAEMLRGEVITDGWSSEPVKDALEWCLACKGCASDCPTHTDMAAYKAEFLSHYYETHLRPRQAHLMGRIGQWAPIAAWFPGVFNRMASLGKSMAGIAPQRRLPQLAQRTFRSGFVSKTRGERVVLFDDTFNNHFRPQTASAAQRVLEAAGCAVELPAAHVCCGRPYYDFGMLGQARGALSRVLDVLEGDAPLVVLEPGCLSVFRKELAQLFPRDPRAARLANRTRSLAEFLRERDFAPKVEGEVLLHGHCHQKALWGMKAERALLAGLDLKTPDSGCCGMSGSFGYRPEFYDASLRIAGLELLPALERMPTARVLADGFSCREQIEALSGRPTLHLAELLSASLR
jgi:Fe-S oxidoreductase